MWLAVWVGNTQLSHDPWFPSRPGIAGGTVFEGWQRWDAYWYRAIVRDGYVYYPDVNEIEEMTDMMSATRSFETSVDVLNRVRSMQQGLLKLGEQS